MSEVALVTGASRGIGRAVAVELARRGFAVAVNYARDTDAAKETQAQVESVGSESIVVQADVADSAMVDSLFDEVEDGLGPVGVLVNNAGVRRDGLALSMSDEAWDEVIRTNLFGTFTCCRRALRSMLRARSGRIVNIASTAGLRGSPGQANYAAAKAGVIGLTKTLAREFAGRGITVNSVAPGLIDTDLTATMTDKQKDALRREIPQQRAGTTEEVASLVGWLCSPDAAYVTGSIYTLDGGLTA
jgi:3-oxoacyl-[acyl-carrier protein] reductase